MRIPTWFVAVLAVALVFGLAAGVMADEAKGKVKSVEKDKVVVTVDGKDVTYSVGKDVDTKDLAAGDEVTVTYTKEGDKATASKIVEKKK